jgi:hypothetical protein
MIAQKNAGISDFDRIRVETIGDTLTAYDIKYHRYDFFFIRIGGF